MKRLFSTSSAALARRVAFPANSVSGGETKRRALDGLQEHRLDKMVKAEVDRQVPTATAQEVHKLSEQARSHLLREKDSLRAKFGAKVIGQLEAALSAGPPPKPNFDRRKGKTPPLKALEVEAAEAEAEVPKETLPSTERRNSYRERRRRALAERGFYVQAGAVRDNYIRGSALEIPDLPLLSQVQQKALPPPRQPDEPDRRPAPQAPKAPKTLDPNIPIPSREHGAERYPNWRHYVQFGEEHQPKRPADHGKWWGAGYGQADPSLPVSQHSCRGCGAEFHAKAANLPGYLPSELLRSLESLEERPLCRRCHLLKHHDFLLNVSVAPVDYRRMMGHLRQIFEALIIVVVDMVDLPNSLIPDLGALVGKGKAVMVVGNKVDLLPPDLHVLDQEAYLAHFRRVLQEAVEAEAWLKDFNLLYTGLLSAKTGFGVEDLVSEVLGQWSGRGDIYLTGCTNAGKSTLFNRLLQSDLCKVRSTDLLERATTSVWPGTTLSLLKFPVLSPAGWHLKAREERLRSARSQEALEAAHRHSLAAAMRQPQLAMLQGYVGRVMNSKTDPSTNRAVSAASQDGYFLTPAEPPTPKRLDPLSHPAFAESNWLHDTPGLLSQEQCLDRLTLEELVEVVPSEMLTPRSLVLNPGDYVLLGGLGRLRYVEGRGSVIASVFASAQLPVHHVKGPLLQRFLARYSGTPVLGAPHSRQPWRLEGAEVEVDAREAWDRRALADVVLSSLGWVALTPLRLPQHTPLVFKAFTPKGQGIALRTTPLVPRASQMKGQRDPSSQAYQTLEPHQVLNYDHAA